MNNDSEVFFMVKRVQFKEKTYEILYENGYPIESISKIARHKSTTLVVTHLNTSGVKPLVDTPNPYGIFTLEEKDVIEKAGLTQAVQAEYLVLISGIANVPKQAKPVKKEESKVKLDPIIEPFKETEEKSVRQQEKERIHRLLKQPDIDNVCSVCQNEGTVYIKTDIPFKTKNIKCPKCKGQSTSRKERITSVSEDTLLEKLIPNPRFRNSRFERMKLEAEAPLPFELKNYLFNHYLDTLDNLISTFRVGLLPKKSILLSAPDSFGKKHAVYECMKECVRHGISCTTLIEFSEIQALLRENKYLEVNEMLDKEVIFLTVSGSGRSLFATPFKYLLDYCDRHGKPVIMISRYESLNMMKHKVGYKEEIKLDWYDVFKETTFDYDYGHLENQGIYGDFAKSIYSYRGKELEQFTQYSPAMMKKDMANKGNPSAPNALPLRASEPEEELKPLGTTQDLDFDI